jgi:hypothetical protein
VGMWSLNSKPSRFIASTSGIEIDVRSDNKTLTKIKNNTWNKVIRAREFDHFNDNEYVKWIALYKDHSNLETVNPVTIEQKMALIEILNGSLLQNENQKNNDLKIRKIKSHFKKFTTDSELKSFSSDLFLILKNPTASLLNYFSHSTTKEMKSSLVNALEEDMLSIGLKGLVARIPEKEVHASHPEMLVKENISAFDWSKFISEENYQWFKGLDLSQDLIEDILVDGLNEHDQELIVHLKNKDMSDQYEKFRRVFRPVSFLFGTYFYYERFSGVKSKKIEDCAALIRQIN